MADVAERRESHRVKQLSLFLPQRRGELLSVTRILEGQRIRVCALSIIDAADHAVARLIVDRPTLAGTSLIAEGYHIFETDLLCIDLPDGVGIAPALKAMLMAELNVSYVYTLQHDFGRKTALALHVTNLVMAEDVATEQGLRLLNQDDLLDVDGPL
ncbi:MAG: hypothetical protein VX916_03050 [Planctomycetota bacterium]|nr:hypothetical protein [Planctomycetota bacterium]